MADQKRFKATDPDSGRTVTFDWSGDAPPTDDDIAEVFAAAAPKDEAPESSGWAERHRGPAALGNAIISAGKALVDPENLPAVGGALGGLVAAPFTGGMSVPAALALTAGGAAVGGAMGAGGRRMQREAEGTAWPATARELAGEMATEGAREGAYQAVGGAVAKGVGKLAPKLYGAALAPKERIAKGFGREAVIAAGLEEGIVPGTRNAVSAGEAAVARAADDTRRIVASSPAASRGLRIKPKSVARGLQPLRKEVATRPTANIAQQQIDTFEQNFLASHPQPKTLPQLVELKRGAQQEAKAAYRAAEGNRMAGMDAEANEAIAKRAREIVERFAPESGPANARTASRIGLAQALEDERARNHVITGLISGAAGAGTGYTTGDPVKGFGAAATAAALRDPRALGALGISLARAGGNAGEQIGVNAARLLRQALLAQMQGAEQEQP